MTLYEYVKIMIILLHSATVLHYLLVVKYGALAGLIDCENIKLKTLTLFRIPKVWETTR